MHEISMQKLVRYSVMNPPGSKYPSTSQIPYAGHPRSRGLELGGREGGRAMLSHSSESGGGRSNAATRAGGGASCSKGTVLDGEAGVAGGVSVIAPICLVRLLRIAVHETKVTAVYSIERTY